MPTTGYTNKDKPFTFPLILEARKHENIVLTENGKANGKVIYLGFTKMVVMIVQTILMLLHVNVKIVELLIL